MTDLAPGGAVTPPDVVPSPSDLAAQDTPETGAEALRAEMVTERIWEATEPDMEALLRVVAELRVVLENLAGDVYLHLIGEITAAQLLSTQGEALHVLGGEPA